MANNINNNKLFFLVISIALILIMVFITGMLIFDSYRNARLVAKVQEKCEEYTNLGCTFQSSGNENSTQIVHGDDVPPNVLPHQVFVYSKSYMGLGGAVCGGTLINEKFVLTAAHCLDNMNLDNVMVQLGDTHIVIPLVYKNDGEKSSRVVMKAKHVYIHPQYQSDNPLIYDICVLELPEKVNFTSNIRPICLNTKFEKNNDPMFSSGWGLTEAEKSIIDGPRQLKMVELHNVDEAEKHCINLLQGPENYDVFNKVGICLAHRTKGINQGDSGGPLQVKRKSNCSHTWEQIGVVSQVGINQYKDGNLTLQLFVRVDIYITWIADKAWPEI